jgi:hypothetical protein
MLRAWVRGRSVAAAPSPSQVALTLAERQRAGMLTARAERAGQSAMWALAAGDWDTAAEWEEQRILSEDEVGRLLLERCLDSSVIEQQSRSE